MKQAIAIRSGTYPLGKRVKLAELYICAENLCNFSFFWDGLRQLDA